jgi:hypothetical protein
LTQTWDAANQVRLIFNAAECAHVAPVRTLVDELQEMLVETVLTR